MKPNTHSGQSDLVEHMENLSLLSSRMRQELEVSLQIEKKKTETLNNRILDVQAKCELELDRTRQENAALLQRSTALDNDLKKWKDAYKALETQLAQKAKEAEQFQRSSEHYKTTWETFHSNYEASDRDLKKANADLERLKIENRDLNRELTQEKKNSMNALQISTETSREMKMALDRLHGMLEKGMNSQGQSLSGQNAQMQVMVQAMNALSKSLDRVLNEQNSGQNRVVQLLQNNELVIARMRNDLELSVARMSDQLLKSVQSMKTNDAVSEVTKLKEQIQKEQNLKNEIKEAIERAVPNAIAPAVAAATAAGVKSTEPKRRADAQKADDEKAALTDNYVKVSDQLRQAREEFRILQRSSLLELERFKEGAHNPQAEGVGTIVLEDLTEM